MQTPSHVVISLFLWRKNSAWPETLAVTAGAILPDLNMFFFYGYQKWIGSSESEIWGTLYFLDQWQLFFDVFNSIPIFLMLMLIGHFWNSRLLFLVSASALVHLLCDLPLHNDDAHRHLLPFSNWRFISPVSYWDPKHYGPYAASLEYLVCLVACFRLSFGRYTKSIRIAGRINLALFVALPILIGILLVVLRTVQ